MTVLIMFAASMNDNREVITTLFTLRLPWILPFYSNQVLRGGSQRGFYRKGAATFPDHTACKAR
jgi:hypothetical protein